MKWFWVYAALAFLIYGMSSVETKRPGILVSEGFSEREKDATFNARFGEWQTIGNVTKPAPCDCELDDDD